MPIDREQTYKWMVDARGLGISERSIRYFNHCAKMNPAGLPFFVFPNLTTEGIFPKDGFKTQIVKTRSEIQLEQLYTFHYYGVLSGIVAGVSMVRANKGNPSLETLCTESSFVLYPHSKGTVSIGSESIGYLLALRKIILKKLNLPGVDNNGINY